MMRLSVLALDIPKGRFCPEGGKCLGVDVSAGPVTPLNELSRPDFCLDGPESLVIEAFEILLSVGFPFGECGMPAPVGQERFE